MEPTLNQDTHLNDLPSALRENLQIRTHDAQVVLEKLHEKHAQSLAAARVTNVDGAALGLGKTMAADRVRAAFLEAGFTYPTPARIISMLMCKGGVGKTSTTYFLAQRLAMYGARVLVIDADPQGNLTGAFNLESADWGIDEETPVLTDLFDGTCLFEEVVIAVTPQLHLIPSTPLNSVLDGKIRDRFKNPSLPMRRILDGVALKYDYILIDCAPALNLTNTAMIGASHMVVLPVAPDKFSEMGLKQTLNEIEQIERDFNLSIGKKILLTKIDAREFTSKKYVEELRARYAEWLAPVVIRTSSDVKNVITRNEDLFSSSRSVAREDYDLFAQHVMGI